jgi:hypothetical protein
LGSQISSIVSSQAQELEKSEGLPMLKCRGQILGFSLTYHPQDFQIQVCFILEILVKTAPWNPRMLDNALNAGQVVAVFGKFFFSSPDNSVPFVVR